MASISTDARGNRRILFVDPDGKRKPIRVGKLPMKATEAMRSLVESLLAAKTAGVAWDQETAGKVRKLGDEMADRFAAVGLIPKRESSTLKAFVEEYVAGRTDVKPATKEIWGQGKKSLLEHFGDSRPLRSVTEGDADAYRAKLAGGKLASMTARKRMQFAKMIFRAAKRSRLIDEDPFADVGIKASQPDRFRFVTRAETAKLLGACPNLDWRCVVGLARYGGLRCPSEVLSIKWPMIDWARNRMTVVSPKTEHHPGKESRPVPIDPELLAILGEAYLVAADREGYVVDERMRRGATGPHGWRNSNLRQTFSKIVARAGLEKWPRLFHNLRSSRQIELAEELPAHVVCEFMGNSEDIARKSYLKPTDEHFEKVSGKAAQKQAHQPSTTTPNDTQPRGAT